MPDLLRVLVAAEMKQYLANVAVRKLKQKTFCNCNVRGSSKTTKTTTATATTKAGIKTCCSTVVEAATRRDGGISGEGDFDPTRSAKTSDIERVVADGVGVGLSAHPGDVRDTLDSDKWINGKGRVKVRGISSWRKWYNASITIGPLLIVSRRCQDLSVTLDNLMILTTIKHQALSQSSNSDDFPAALRTAVRDALGDADSEATALLGMRFKFRLRLRYWMGTQQVNTPETNDLETALRLWPKFSELRRELRCSKSNSVIGLRGCTGYLLNKHSPVQMEKIWQRFSEMYIEACLNFGQRSQYRHQFVLASAANADDDDQRRGAIAARLQNYAAANESHRDKMLRAWNTTQMIKEDLRARKLARAERKRCKAHEAHERQQMKKLSRTDIAEQLQKRWQQLQEKRQRYVKSLEARTKKEKAIRLQKLAKEEELQKRAAAKKEKAQREARWKFLMRKNATMEEILGRW
eukprot:TRINITY_DN12876_c0_g1_i1.p1 TRINITY_DN12876_c0_g1~~TRINITY_DN12876_c0_g1_i1.p1  ORF type:complete len:465 (+),score=84.90 TRINITY_DN12876_c0_g1_i1:493-1887(+)